MTWTCGQCADEGHAALLDHRVIACPVRPRNLMLRDQQCGYELKDLGAEHAQALCRLDALERLIAARGSDMQPHAFARGAFPDLKGIVGGLRPDLGALLAEARDALAKTAWAAVQAGVPVDELWPEHNGLGARISEALVARGNRRAPRGADETSVKLDT